MSFNTFRNAETRKFMIFYFVLCVILLIWVTIAKGVTANLIPTVIFTYFLINTVTYFILDRHYLKIRDITLKLEQISRGDFTANIDNQRTGDVAILEYQMYQMSKRIQASLECAQTDRELLKNTISGLSHQFKTPITVLRTFNDLLIDGAIEDATVAREFVEKSAIQLDKLEKLVFMFLKLSKLEAGITLINKSNSELDITVRDIVNSLQEKAFAKGQVICFEQHTPIFALYDQQWLFEAIYIIIENAIQYTPSNGRINVSVMKMETMSCVEVKDTGMGICEEDLPRIFDRFYQGKNIGRNPTSTGIGLSLAKLIIDKHSGIINVESTVGVGTRVIVVLPL